MNQLRYVVKFSVKCLHNNYYHSGAGAHSKMAERGNGLVSALYEPITKRMYGGFGADPVTNWKAALRDELPGQLNLASDCQYGRYVGCIEL